MPVFEDIPGPLACDGHWLLSQVRTKVGLVQRPCRRQASGSGTGSPCMSPGCPRLEGPAPHAASARAGGDQGTAAPQVDAEGRHDGAGGSSVDIPPSLPAPSLWPATSRRVPLSPTVLREPLTSPGPELARLPGCPRLVDLPACPPRGLGVSPGMWVEVSLPPRLLGREGQ